MASKSEDILPELLRYLGTKDPYCDYTNTVLKCLKEMGPSAVDALATLRAKMNDPAYNKYKSDIEDAIAAIEDRKIEGLVDIY